MTVEDQAGVGIGPGTVTVAGRRVPIRWMAVAIGTVVWLGLMILETGEAGLTALWTNAYLLALLVAAATLTRTTSLYAVAWAVLAGGFLMSVMLVLSRLFVAFEPDADAPLRDVAIPLLEELLKLAPAALLVWLGRHGRSWSVGATDLLLLAAGSGIGFGVVEDAFIRANSGWPEEMPFLPVVEIIDGRTIAGHGIWTALAGATLGLGLLLRGWRWPALVLAVLGFAWSALDHVANNMGAEGVLNDIGALTVPLFLFAAASCIVVDTFIVARTLPRLPELRSPPRSGDLAGTARAWNLLQLRRALAFAVFRYRTVVGDGRLEAELEAQWLMDRLGYAADGPATVAAGSTVGPEPSPAGGGAA